jgi:hypothetical protein
MKKDIFVVKLFEKELNILKEKVQQSCEMQRNLEEIFKY